MKRVLIILLMIVALYGITYDETGAGYSAGAMEVSRNQYSDKKVGNQPDINAGGAILIEQSTGKVLFEKNGNSKMYPASTTKILTALVAIENGDLDEVITVGDEIELMDPDGSRAWLKVGEKMKLSNLIMGLLLPSGNDAAYTIAVNIGRKISDNPSQSRDEAIKVFVNKMNERAKEIGANSSNFVNSHGIHNDNHYTTPYDLALIAREALKYDFFRQAVKNYIYEGINTSNEAHKWENTNKLLDKGSSSYYKYATGIKTGHTTPAGYCLVSSGSRENMDVIAVILNTSKENQFKDSITLLNYGLYDFAHYQIIKKGDILQSVKVNNKLPWDDLDLDLAASEGFEDVLKKKDVTNIKWEIQWNNKLIRKAEGESEGVDLLSSLKKGEVLGKAIYTLNGETLGEINIEAGRNIKKRYLIFNLPGAMFIYENRYVTVPTGLLLITGLFLKYSGLRRKRKIIKRQE